MLLEHKVAVVYGAGGVIGSTVARAFAAEGASVHLTGRDTTPLVAIAQEITDAGGSAETARVDALDEHDIQTHIDAVVEKKGRVDISFNAVGFGYKQGRPIVELSVAEFCGALDDALRSQFLTTAAAGRHMVRNGSGVILAITATPARVAIANVGNFGVACAAIEGLCRQLAVDLGPQGVRVVCLRSAGSTDAPGVEHTFEEHARRLGITRDAFEASLSAGTLLKRLPKLAEVANAAVIMASDRASAITGAVANVTCGAFVD